MSNSELVSIIALVVSVIGTIFNFFYTRNQYRASNFPEVEVSLSVIKGGSDTEVMVHVANLSGGVAIQDIECSARIREAEKPELFSRRKWFYYGHTALSTIYPHKQEYDALVYTARDVTPLPGLETFLVRYFPKILRTAGTSHEVIGNTLLEAMVVVVYRPAVVGSGRVTKRVLCRMYRKVESSQLSYWTVQDRRD